MPCCNCEGDSWGYDFCSDYCACCFYADRKEAAMARCEDFPCCGHELGCCPDYDESGRQMNMKCVCGATVPLHSRFSLCDSCLNTPDPEDYCVSFEYDDDGYMNLPYDGPIDD